MCIILHAPMVYVLTFLMPTQEVRGIDLGLSNPPYLSESFDSSRPSRHLQGVSELYKICITMYQYISGILLPEPGRKPSESSKGTVMHEQNLNIPLLVTFAISDVSYAQSPGFQLGNPSKLCSPFHSMFPRVAIRRFASSQEREARRRRASDVRAGHPIALNQRFSPPPRSLWQPSSSVTYVA